MSNTKTNSVKQKKVSKKKPVSFMTQEVFDKGFKPDSEKSFCTVSRLLFRNVINVDGSIDMEQLVNVKKGELWLYIYYLYMYNNSTIPEFIKMKSPSTGKADATRFHDVVYTDDYDVIENKKLNTDIVRILYFINRIVHTYKGDLINPVIDYLNQLMKKEMVAKLSNIKVQMVPEKGATNANSGKKNVRIGFELVKP
jgi:hypothetical protein